MAELANGAKRYWAQSTILLMVLVLAILVIIQARTVLAAPVPYKFHEQQIAPYKSPLCAGEPLTFPLGFTINIPQGEHVTVNFNTTWQRLNPNGSIGTIEQGTFGLIESPGMRHWVYHQSFTEYFPRVEVSPPAAVVPGHWAYSGSGHYGTNQEEGYTVKVEYIDCEESTE